MTYNELQMANLEEVLLQKGLPINHIENLKRENPKDLTDYYEYYEGVSETRTLVDPNKIVGFERASTTISYYDNASGIGKSNFDPGKMATFLQHIRDDSLKDLYFWYEDLYKPVELNYFSDEDIYSVSFDGNHRSLYAKIIGAPAIKANIHIYKRNEEEYQNYLSYKNLISKFSMESIRLSWYDYSTEATFLYKEQKYIVRGYAYPRINGGYAIEQIRVLEVQLFKDFECLNNKYANSLLRGIYLNFFVKESDQRYRISQHFNNRIKLDRNG